VSEVVPVVAGLRVDVAQDGVVPLGAGPLGLVLGHLTANAAMAGARVVTLTVAADTLVVQDDGPGVPPGDRDRIFDPFFTTNREDGGTGMGLPIVRRVLQAHGADIVLRSGNEGARFEINMEDCRT
jgi:signal transduction histidine kinase